MLQLLQWIHGGQFGSQVFNNEHEQRSMSEKNDAESVECGFSQSRNGQYSVESVLEHEKEILFQVILSKKYIHTVLLLMQWVLLLRWSRFN
jgi:hypothetical protein